jgi:hypothetical protein
VWASGKKPFADIADMYLRRKLSKSQDYALKIVMNATYGKMAQVLERRVRTNVADHNAEIFDGQIWKKKIEWKDHTSFVYAAEITARIRMKIFNDVDPRHVIFYATDAVMTTRPIPLVTGGNLGEWADGEAVRNLVVVGSGVYSYDEDKKTVVKFRGFSRNMDLRGMLYRAGRRHTVGMSVLRNTSLRRAVGGGRNAQELNILRQTRRVLNVNFDQKRYWPERWTARELTKSNFKSQSLIHYGTTKLDRVKS